MSEHKLNGIISTESMSFCRVLVTMEFLGVAYDYLALITLWVA